MKAPQDFDEIVRGFMSLLTECDYVAVVVIHAFKIEDTLSGSSLYSTIDPSTPFYAEALDGLEKQLKKERGLQ